METGPAVAAQLQPWVLILNVGTESTGAPAEFLHFLHAEFAASPVSSAGELDEAGNARPAFFMRLFDTKVSADCHKVYYDGNSANFNMSWRQSLAPARRTCAQRGQYYRR